MACSGMKFCLCVEGKGLDGGATSIRIRGVGCQLTFLEGTNVSQWVKGSSHMVTVTITSITPGRVNGASGRSGDGNGEGEGSGADGDNGERHKSVIEGIVRSSCLPIISS